MTSLTLPIILFFRSGLVSHRSCLRLAARLRSVRLILASMLVMLPMHCPLSAGTAYGERPAPAGDFDGPAELPRRYLKSSLADTPAPGRVRVIKEGEDLQQALDDAKCGDTLKLQAGATFAGVFRFPKKACDDEHWIVIRSSTPDDALPPENTMLTPCYAGVASLPGRPDFHCSSVHNVLAKLELNQKREAGPVLLQDGANHYRLMGLEITRNVPELRMRNLVQPENAEDSADHLVFDRLWLHGDAHSETKGGIHLSGTTDVAIVDSFFTDFHCIARSGSCIDSQAINGGGGDRPGGPYKIVDNFLEASGEDIMFGGAPGTTTPADIEIRHNHLFKPLLWMPGQPGFIGAADGNPFIVKNCLELKNAQRVLIEGNIMENAWGGFSQTGFAILLMPANQGGHCAACRVVDVTVRYNRISHAGGAMGIGTPAPKGPTSGGERYSIHDLVFDDLDMATYKGLGSLAVIASVAPALGSIHFDHITAFPPRVLFTVHNTADKLKDFSFTNSIVTVGDRGMLGTGGGEAACTRGMNTPGAILENCFANAIFKNNLIIGGSGGWPKGNREVKKGDAAGLRSFRDGHGGDYRPCREKGETPDCQGPSPALKAATDGRDLGADLDTIERMTNGII